jgi:hypothetical protein
MYDGVRVTRCGLRVAGCELLVAGYGLRGAGYGLRAAGYGLRVAGYGLRATGCGVKRHRAEGIEQNKRCWEAGKLGRWEAFIFHFRSCTIKSKFRHP